MEDVTAWVHAAPQEVLAAAGARQNALGLPAAPHPDTVVRLLAALGAQSLADCAGAFLARREHPGPVTLPVAGPGMAACSSRWTARPCAGRPGRTA